MAQMVRVRRLSRQKLRLGFTAITNTAAGTLVNLDDPKVLRDFRYFKPRLEVLVNDADVRSGAVETLPTSVAVNTTATQSTTKIRFTPIKLNAGDTVTGLTYASATTAGATMTGAWVSLWSGTTTLTEVAVSANTSAPTSAATWAANKAVTFAFTANYTVPTTATYFAGLVTIATTVPTLLGFTYLDATLFGGSANNGLETTAVRTTTPAAIGATLTASDISADLKVPWVVANLV